MFRNGGNISVKSISGVLTREVLSFLNDRHKKGKEVGVRKMKVVREIPQ